MSNVTPEIKTKFSLGGLSEAASGFKKFGDQTRESLNKIRQSGSKTLEPFQKDVEKAKQSIATLKAVSMNVGIVGFGTLRMSANAAFSSVKYGAMGAVAALGSISAAAVKMSKDTAEEWNNIGNLASKFDMSPEDISVLGFAGGQGGVEVDKMLGGLSKVAGSFANIKEKIAEADKEFSSLLKHAETDAGIARAEGDLGGIVSAANSFKSVSRSSLQGIEEQRAKLQASLASFAQLENNDLGMFKIAHQFRKELDELDRAEKSLRKSFGAIGEAFFTLQKYGLNVEQASKGGTQSLYALSDAIKKVESSEERLKIARQLFGDDGKQLLPLLEGGRGAIKEYREELERLGAVVSKDDVDISTKYGKSADKLKKAFSGIRFAIAREVLPSLTEGADSFTNFLVEKRNAIAGFFKSGFMYVSRFFQDLVGLFEGKREGFKTPFLDDVVKTLSKISEEITKVWNNEKSDFPWLNILADGLRYVNDLVVDLYRVLNNEPPLKWHSLTDLKKDISEFTDKLKSAFEGILSVLNFVKKLLTPIANLFGTDPTTMLLFLGMAKFIGVLGLATTAVSTLMGLVGTLFSMAGGGALVSSIGAITAAAAGTTIGAAGIGAGTLAAGAGILAAGAVVGAGVGYVGGTALGNAIYDPKIEKSFADLRAGTKNSADESFKKWSPERQGKFLDLHNKNGIYDDYLPYYKQNLANTGAADIWNSANYQKPNNIGTQEAVSRSVEKVDINLTLGGKDLGTGSFDPLTAQKMKQTLYSMQRNGG